MHRGVTRFLPQARGHGRAQDSLGTKVKTRLQRNPAFKKTSLKIGTFPRSRRGAEGCRNLRVTFGTRKPLQPPAPLLLKAVSGRGYATAWRFCRLPHSPPPCCLQTPPFSTKHREVAPQAQGTHFASGQRDQLSQSFSWTRCPFASEIPALCSAPPLRGGTSFGQRITFVSVQDIAPLLRRGAMSCISTSVAADLHSVPPLLSNRCQAVATPPPGVFVGYRHQINAPNTPLGHGRAPMARATPCALLYARFP